MFKTTFTAALVAATVGAVGPAHAIVSETKQLVRPTGPGDFVVQFRADRSAQDYWCSAGEYVIRELNLPRNTRIFRTAPPPRPQAEGVTFSLSSEGAVHSGLARISTTGRPGLSASQAYQLCRALR